jgi:hypothetical protein
MGPAAAAAADGSGSLASASAAAAHRLATPSRRPARCGAVFGSPRLFVGSDIGDELREMLQSHRLTALRDWVELRVESHPSSVPGRLLARYMFG